MKKQDESSKPGAENTGSGRMILYEAVKLYIKAGGTLVTDEIKNERLTECNRCPEQRGFEELKTCALCGCFLTLKAAADRYFSLSDLKFVTSSCPLNRWPQ